jgi:hypothetical protein
MAKKRSVVKKRPAGKKTSKRSTKKTTRSVKKTSKKTSKKKPMRRTTSKKKTTKSSRKKAASRPASRRAKMLKSQETLGYGVLRTYLWLVLIDALFSGLLVAADVIGIIGPVVDGLVGVVKLYGLGMFLLSLIAIPTFILLRLDPKVLILPIYLLVVIVGLYAYAYTLGISRTISAGELFSLQLFSVMALAIEFGLALWLLVAEQDR